MAAVLTVDTGNGTDYDRLNDVLLLDGAAGGGRLDGGDDHVADAGKLTLGAAEHTDAHYFLGAGVIGYL